LSALDTKFEVAVAAV